MKPAENLLLTLEQMLAELEQYLLSPELFWPLSPPGRKGPQERFTLGNLLLSLDQLHASQVNLDSKAATRLRAIELKWETAMVKWKSAMVRKGSMEVGSRLNLWKAYATDLGDGKDAAFDYLQEVRNRVIIEKLFELGVNRRDWEDELQASDRLLHSLVKSSEFVWPAELRESYPPDLYWYLYRTPRELD